MARERTLLSRVAQAAPSGRARLGDQSGAAGPTTQEDTEALCESVRDHLARLLNARHGMCEAMPDYGLPALSDLIVGTGDHVRLVQEAIKTAIEKYEPRLRRVKVSRVVDPDRLDGRTLAFRIEAVLIGRQAEHRVWYETSVRGSGEFEVSD